MVVARDMRPSGVELAAAFTEGATGQGVDVVDLGLASTDLIYFAAGRLDAPGAMFTASHNPAQYNGIKLCLSGARPVGQDTGLAEIKAMAAGDLPARCDAGQGDPTASYSTDYAEHVRAFVDAAVLRPLKVVADTANGMGGLVVPEVFAGLPFELEILFPELDGTFPNHPADPIQPENLKDAAGAGARDERRHRSRLRRRRRPGVPRRRARPSRCRARHDRDGRRRRCSAKHPGSTIIHNLICSKAVPEIVARTAARRCGPGSATRSSSR